MRFRLTILISVILGCSLLVCCQDVGEVEQFPLLEKDIAFLQKQYSEGLITIQEVTRAYLDRIEMIDVHGPGLNSIIAVNPDAMKIAEMLDQELKDGKSRGALHGIPVLLKDNIDTHDQMPTTAGSRALANSYADKDAHLVELLRKAGAVILGKANLSEWANFRGQESTSGWSGLGGLTKNPYLLANNPCGSSAGSAASVSANLCMLAIGTETNGSIVCPAHSCGVVGIKPTVGLISRSGIIPISHTLDTPGPMARTLRDAAIGLGAMVGVESLDARTQESVGSSYRDYTQFLKIGGLKGKRLGWLRKSKGLNPEVDSLMDQVMDFMKEKGCEIVFLDSIWQQDPGRYSFQVMLYEYKDGLNKYLSKLAPDVPIDNLEDLIAFNLEDSIELRFFNQRYLELAQSKGDLNTAEYIDALKRLMKESRDLGIDRVMQLFDLDAIIAPTGGPAWKTDLINGDSFEFGSSSPAALAGYPSITVPMGFAGNLPIGVSFFGRAWSEPLLLEIAYAFEQGTKHRQAPRFLHEE